MKQPIEQPIELTSLNTDPNNKLLTLAWKVMAQANVRKFTLRVGTEPGKWDIFNGDLSKDIKEITLPRVTGNKEKLFAELDYTAPEDQGGVRLTPSSSTNKRAAQPHPHHHHEEHIMHGEKPLEIP